MTVQGFTANQFGENTYLAHADGEAALIDPGTSERREHEQVLDVLESRDLRVRHLLLTHVHLDHILGCAFFAERLGGRFRMHPDALELYRHGEEQSQMFGVPLDPLPEPGDPITESDEIRLGDAVWTIRHTPGHSPGSICFYDEANGFLISGDVIFQGSVGRTDLWKGSMEVLLDSIRTQVLTLPDETVLYPGHGPETTVGEERASNPFIAEIA